MWYFNLTFVVIAAIIHLVFYTGFPIRPAHMRFHIMAPILLG